MLVEKETKTVVTTIIKLTLSEDEAQKLKEILGELSLNGAASIMRRSAEEADSYYRVTAEVYNVLRRELGKNKEE